MLVATLYPGGALALLGFALTYLCGAAGLLALIAGSLARWINAPKHWPFAEKFFTIAIALGIFALLATAAETYSLIDYARTHTGLGDGAEAVPASSPTIGVLLARERSYLLAQAATGLAIAILGYGFRRKVKDANSPAPPVPG